MSCRTGTLRFTDKKQSKVYSCFSNQSLVKIARSINHTYSGNKIPDDIIQKVETQTKDDSKVRRKLIGLIREALRPNCNEDLPHHEDSCAIQTLKIDLGDDNLIGPFRGFGQIHFQYRHDI